jgi:fumarylacetoacetase
LVLFFKKEPLLFLALLTRGKPMPDPTHDPSVTSWVEGADQVGTDFPIQNLPHGIFRRRGAAETFRGGVAIGDMILDLGAVRDAGGLGDASAQALAAASADRLNGLMSLGKRHWKSLRSAVFAALQSGAPDRQRLQSCLVPQADVEYAVPASIGDFSDFYTSIHHARTVGAMLRPQSPLMPNYPWVPIAYHGRSSSIVISGSGVPRPVGQFRAPGAEAPAVGPCERLDYELELGFFIGPGNALGAPIAVADAEDHVFGACILNDWSARDIQSWEYQPLGPFLGKNFASTISPWIVTMEALAPFRAPFARPPGEPAPLPCLALGPASATAAIDVHLDVGLQTAAMRAQGVAALRLSRSNYRSAFWTLSQMVAHHTSNGCNLRPGDLLGTGTLSGPGADERGCLMEITSAGRAPLMLPTGESRGFLGDGDSIVMRAWCDGHAARRIGFGACEGIILPAGSLAKEGLLS